MRWLWFVTLIWAFSFSLIGVYLAGKVDGYFAVLSRMLLALIVFLPFMSWKHFFARQSLLLMAIGAIQIGLMYLFFYHSFLYLTVPEVLLFTILTPVYVSLFDDMIFARQIRSVWLWPALMSVVGAAILRFQNLSSDFILGLLLVQLANMCFAFGQVAYKRLALGDMIEQRNRFGYFFLGAAMVSLIASLLFTDWNYLPTEPQQIFVILWLGIVASGVGYFLWNHGAKQVNIGQLATMNNALIPVGLLVNLIFWQQSIQWWSFICGGSIIILAVVWTSKIRNRDERRPLKQG